MRITVTVTYKYKLLETFLQFLKFSEERDRRIPFDLYKCSCPSSPGTLNTANRVSVKEGQLSYKYTTQPFKCLNGLYT